MAMLQLPEPLHLEHAMNTPQQAPYKRRPAPIHADRTGGMTESYPSSGVIMSFADMSTATDPRAEIRPRAYLSNGQTGGVMR